MATAPSVLSSPSLQDVITADLGATDSGPAQAAVDSTTDSSGLGETASPSVDEQTAAEIAEIPGDEDQPQTEAPQSEEPPPAQEQQAQQPAQEDDEQKPEIPNLSESRWKNVHAPYKWAREVGKALGVVGEDGRVDVSLLPTVDEIRSAREALTDRMAMEHDFTSADPQNAERFISNWNQFSPEGMAVMAAKMPDALARLNPQGYQAMAAPILNRFIDSWVARTLNEIDDPQLKENLLHAAQTAEWWATGGPNGGRYRSREELMQLGQQQAQQGPVDPREANLRQREMQLQQQDQQRAQAATQAVLGDIQTQTKTYANTLVEDRVGKVLASKGLNQFAVEAAKDRMVKEITASMTADTEGRRQFQIAMDRAMRSKQPQDIEKVVKLHRAMVDRAVFTRSSKIITEATKGFQASTDARHQQLRQQADKRAPVSGGGAPRPQSVVAAEPVRRPDESAAEFQRRRIMHDMGVAS